MYILESLPFLEGFLRTGRYTNNFPRTYRQNPGVQTRAWLDDILLVTKGYIEKHEAEVRETKRKLEEAGY